MTPDTLVAALRAAGFAGVVLDTGQIFARTHPTAPEFQASQVGATWHLTLSRPVRASAAALAAWNADHPTSPADIHRGETRLTLILATPAALTLWRARADHFTAQSQLWRRAQRQGDEGM